MFQISTETHPAQETVIRNPYLNREVLVDTMFYERQVGLIARVRLSPFHGDTRMMAYIVGQGWTEYAPINDLCDCTDCGRMMDCSLCCPECGFCANCCTCQPSWLDDDEFEEYEQRYFYFNGVKISY